MFGREEGRNEKEKTRRTDHVNGGEMSETWEGEMT